MYELANETAGATGVLQASPDLWISVILLALFLFVAWTFLKILKNTIVIGLLAAVFPFVSNWLLGTDFSTNMAALLNFATIGIALYIIYVVLGFLCRSSAIAFKLVAFLLLPFKVVLGAIKSVLFRKKKKKEEKSG